MHKAAVISSFAVRAAAAAALAIVAGCTPQAPPPAIPPPQPLSVQLLRTEPQLQDQRFVDLLQFESPSDIVFAVTEPTRARIDGTHPHTGHASLSLPLGATALTIKLPALLPNENFPGNWTLLGAYFYSDKDSTIVASYAADDSPQHVQRSVQLGGGKWTPIFLDIAPLAEHPAPAQNLTFTVSPDARICCDDVMLIDNAQTLVNTLDETALSGWQIARKGFQTTITFGNRSSVTLFSPEARRDGWTLRDISDARACFISASKTWTLYADGRAYNGGRCEPIVKRPEFDPQLRACHESPAGISVPDDLGKVDRSTDGDKNNDGYNEALGAYQIIADGSRLDVTLTPKGTALIRPVLEIANFPRGNVLATIEGQLISNVTRTSTNHLLIELPVKIERPTTVNLRLQ
ncbi:MAG TPA: hypothetical protein VIL86_06605 [Tepidisphaeraceae bacterium]|jgi:hypothetical protein